VNAAGLQRLLRYRGYGLSVASALPIGDLAADSQVRSAPDLIVRVGRLARLDESAPVSHGIRFVAAGERFGFEAPGAGRFLVIGDSEIVVDPAPGATPRWLEAHLSNVALPVILYRLGRLVLHASCAAKGGAAYAFAGVSGVGKSTLAAHLEERGCDVLADDMCVIEIGAGGAVVLPGPTRMKLWPDTLAGLGREAAEQTPVETSAKLFEPLRPALTRPVPLRALYLLKPALYDAKRLTGAAAFDAMNEQVYRPELPRLLGIADAHMARMAAALRQAVCLAYPWRDQTLTLGAELDRLHAHMEAL